MKSVNFCRQIIAAARAQPQRLALRVPNLEQAPGNAATLSYGELLTALANEQSRLQRAGIGQGDRVLLLLTPGVALYIELLALLGLGAVPVLVERGLARSTLRRVLASCGAQAAIGEQRLIKFWWLFPALWRMRRYASDRACFGVGLLPAAAPNAEPVATPLADSAHGLITFTSGSTGLPKGADRTHGSLIAQHQAIREHWPDRDDDIDLPCFPVLVLHNLSCGISTVLPETDLAFPGAVDADRILAQIDREGITRLTGAPAYMERLTTAALRSNWRSTRVRSVVVGGSTPTHALVCGLRRVFPAAEILFVYGSTEAEPIAEIGIESLLADWAAEPGHLVGRPASMAQVCIVDPDAGLHDEHSVAAARRDTGSDGEILVAGPHVLRAYVDNPEATAAGKIPRSDGLVWHRTGDLGHFDGQGRLWLTGRVRDRIAHGDERLAPYPLEKQLDAMAGVQRSALLQHQGRPALVLQGRPLDEDQLHYLLAECGLTGIDIRSIERMPVDIRHNSKLDRVALRQLLAAGTLPRWRDSAAAGPTSPRNTK